MERISVVQISTPAEYREGIRVLTRIGVHITLKTCMNFSKEALEVAKASITLLQRCQDEIEHERRLYTYLSRRIDGRKEAIH